MTNKDKYVLKLIDLFKKKLSSYTKEEWSRRIFHPKMHAFLKAKFIIEKNIPERLKIGLLAGYQFNAEIRYSTGSREIKHDRKRGVRGLAMRVYSETAFHDFLLSNAPVFPTRNLKQSYWSFYILFKGGLILFFGSLLIPLAAVRAMKSAIRIDDILNTPFFSQTPYFLGLPGDPHRQLVKYKVLPQKIAASETHHDFSSPDYLTEVIKSRLKNEKNVTLDFFIQFAPTQCKDPYNPTIEWKTEFIKVASISIDDQEFLNEEHIKMGQDMEFNPGNSLAEHMPAGEINIGRAHIYNALAQFRKERMLNSWK